MNNKLGIIQDLKCSHGPYIAINDSIGLHVVYLLLTFKLAFISSRVDNTLSSSCELSAVLVVLLLSEVFPLQVFWYDEKHPLNLYLNLPAIGRAYPKHFYTLPITVSRICCFSMNAIKRRVVYIRRKQIIFPAQRI